MPVISIDPVKKVAIDRGFALADLDDWFAEMTAPGFDTGHGWRIGMTPQDVSLLTGQFVLSKEADAAGLDLPPIIDTEGVPHSLESIEELTALMLAYGQARAALSAEYAFRKAAILGNNT